MTHVTIDISGSPVFGKKMETIPVSPVDGTWVCTTWGVLIVVGILPVIFDVGTSVCAPPEILGDAIVVKMELLVIFVFVAAVVFIFPATAK